jgi:hypothetical protein
MTEIPATLLVKDVPEPPKPAEGHTFSTIELSRISTAAVRLEHPTGWSPEEVHAAAIVRMYDVGNAAPFYMGDTRTAITKVTLGEMPAEDHGGRVKLSDDDLSEQE